jgi:predicted transcriptional regulator YdeE
MRQDSNKGSSYSCQFLTYSQGIMKIEPYQTKEKEMEIKTIQQPALTVVGLKYRGKNENDEIPQMWGALMSRTGEIANMSKEPVAYGVCTNMDKESGEFDYIAGYRVSGSGEIPEGMVAFPLPAGKYAVFTTTLPQLGDTYQNAYHTWLPEAGIEPTGDLDIEVYDERFDPHNPDSVFDILILIK